LGEYTAMVFAGALDFESGLRVVQRRGEAMQAAADRQASGMVSILGLDVPKIDEICQTVRDQGNIIQVANLLCPGNTVISGDRDACAKAAELAAKAGAMKTIPLAVAGAFHTVIMQPAVEKLAEALEAVELRKPRIPVVSNVDAQPHNDPEEIRQILVRQVVSAVRWEDSMRWLLAQSVNEMYEVGPGRVLRGLMKRIDRKMTLQGAMDES
jgi:[acyl-carrier-protein] S-malonyltransferase